MTRRRWHGLLAAALLVAGCSEGYRAERMFWRAQHDHAAVLKDPTKATPQQVAAAVHSFEEISHKTPGTPWAARSQMMIGTLYLGQKDYDKARESFGLVLQNYNRYQDLALRARVAIAKSFEVQGKWEDAVRVYKDVSEYHPWSRLGLEAPLYIGAMYEQRKEKTHAMDAYERAVHIYTRMVPDSPTPEMAMQVRGYLTLAYQRLGEWDKAIALLEELAKAETGGVNRPLVLLTLGSIYDSKLSNKDKAAEVYGRLIHDFPENPLGKVAREQRKKLGFPDDPSEAGKPALPQATPSSTGAR